eukprot:6491805-Amphidinium_carterae.1
MKIDAAEGKIKVGALWWRQHKAMYAAEAANQDSALVIETDPPPEPMWTCFKGLLHPRPDLNAFKQHMSTLRADGLGKDQVVMMCKSLQMLKYQLDVGHFHTAMEVPEVVRSMQRLIRLRRSMRRSSLALAGMWTH